jgi:hypothetical protein
MSGSALERQATGGFDATIIHRGDRDPFRLRAWLRAERHDHTWAGSDISARYPGFHVVAFANRNPAGRDFNRSRGHRPHADRSDVEQLRLRWKHFILYRNGNHFVRDGWWRSVRNRCGLRDNWNNVVVRWRRYRNDVFERLLGAIVGRGFTVWNSVTALEP